MTMTDVKAICKAAWGRNWQVALSLRLGVNPSTVSRWTRGKVPPPDDLLEIVKLAIARDAARLLKLSGVTDVKLTSTGGSND